MRVLGAAASGTKLPQQSHLAEVLEDARREAHAILSEIREEKERGVSRHGPLLDHMKRQWGARIGMMDVG